MPGAFFSPSTMEFYHQRKGAPSDVIPVSDDLHNEVVTARRNGHEVVLDERGRPKVEEVVQEIVNIPEALEPEPTFRTVSRFALRAALFKRGRLEAADAVAATSRPWTRFVWMEAPTFSEDSGSLQEVLAQIMIRGTALEKLFDAAEQFE